MGSKRLMPGFTAPLIKVSSSAQVPSTLTQLHQRHKERRISIIKRPVVHFAVIYLCEVILPVYQLFDDVKVVCIGHILHGYIQS